MFTMALSLKTAGSGCSLDPSERILAVRASLTSAVLPPRAAAHAQSVDASRGAPRPAPCARGCSGASRPSVRRVGGVR